MIREEVGGGGENERLYRLVGVFSHACLRLRWLKLDVLSVFSSPGRASLCWVQGGGEHVLE